METYSQISQTISAGRQYREVGFRALSTYALSARTIFAILIETEQILFVPKTSIRIRILRRTLPTQPQSADGSSLLQEISLETITVAIFCTLPYEAAAVRYCLEEDDHYSVSKSQVCHGGQGRPRDPNFKTRSPWGRCRQRSSDNHLGVVQYEFGKYEEDGFDLKGCLNKPPSILLSARLRREAHYRRFYAKLLRNLGSVAQVSKIPCLTGTVPISIRRMIAANMKKYVEGRLSPQARYHPMVHRGLILSGGGIISNTVDRERLRRGYKDSLCYETEAVGIMDEIPCLVIRVVERARVEPYTNRFETKRLGASQSEQPNSGISRLPTLC
ncbi:hypothetical protein TSTA_030010 [Talaromyces stipitatus ATCC 10500]|uniref:Uncharacterized protein n=1 Tax=Talaromyces stipitatus (strain ATCC 10500 / CBS 375.48 / QM 6759 / NRRL 1006) TaxID=441959 RepID=B8M5C4_TALSN|nr:uncharacterized protein TSTA_030010 [Talaromyces stipitatus ATCC 10500]EED19730.1 hypothetical protein TSTA_030010 [Talaromyces stipitatus ATCC 10500]